MITMPLSALADVVSDRIDNPSLGETTRFVGLEHYDAGEIVITRSSSSEKVTSAMKSFRKGDVLVARRNVYLKRAAMVEFDGITSGDSIVLRAHNKIHARLLPFLLNLPSFWDYANMHADGTMSKRLSVDKLLDYSVVLPEEEDIQSVSDLLWAHYRLRLAYKAVLKRIDDLIKSQFVEMFENGKHDFPECTIIESCVDKDDIKCGPFGTQLKQSEYTKSGVAVWGIPEINAEFGKKPEIFVTPEKAEELSSFSLIPGDIAMSRKGNVGQCAIYPDSFEPGIIASDVLRIRVDRSKLVPKFMQYQLHNSESVRNQILQVSNGAVMAGINVTKLKMIKVFIPPVELQKQFMIFAEQTDKSKYYVTYSYNGIGVEISVLFTVLI